MKLDSPDVLITNGRILTMTENNRIIKNGFIAVKGDAILALGDMTELPPDCCAEKVIDAAGGIVMPGLINTHTPCRHDLLPGHCRRHGASNMAQQLYISSRGKKC